ncbi:hypothetical protein ANMWB30_23880 [Arthrobacter sp. MWB30]|nr:hypothetical protein ANMWB30_23880 [Arthrobacter sp. MWB30]
MDTHSAVEPLAPEEDLVHNTLWGQRIPSHATKFFTIDANAAHAIAKLVVADNWVKNPVISTSEALDAVCEQGAAISWKGTVYGAEIVTPETVLHWFRPGVTTATLIIPSVENPVTLLQRGRPKGCTEKCWAPVECSHGYRMPPAGRSIAPEAYTHDCEESQTARNTRHLFDEHDSTRWYTDKPGWKAHEDSCGECNPKDGDDD